MATTNSFVFYRSFYESLQDLDDKSRLQLYDAICSYSLDNNMADLKGFSATIFKLIKPQIDSNKKKRSDGNKGGRPKTNGLESEEPVVNKDVNQWLLENKPNGNANGNANGNEDNNTNGSGTNDKSLNLLEFVSKFNDVRKSKFSHKNEKLANQLNARLKEGFIIDQIISATKNAMREKYHIENRYRHLTPEFMLRQDKLEKYLDTTSAPNEKPIELYDGKEIHESNGRRFVFYGETIKYIYPPVPDTTGWTDEEKYNYFTCDRFNDTWAEKYKNARDNQMNTTEAEKRGIYKYFYDQETLRFKIADHRNVRTS